MAVTTNEKRGRLEDAWSMSGALIPPTSLRAYLRTQEQAARAAISRGSLKSVKANSQEYEYSSYGPGVVTQAEIVELYRWLIDSFDSAFSFLSQCAQYGFDPFVVAFTTFEPGDVVNTPILIDSTGRFATLCAQFGFDVNTVIGVAISDKSVFLWMMYFTVAVTECQSDFSGMRVADGGIL